MGLEREKYCFHEIRGTVTPIYSESILEPNNYGKIIFLSSHNFIRFSYVLGWHYNPIISLLYDQPFHHNNPTRNPFPSTEFRSSLIQLGKYSLSAEMINKIEGYHMLDYDHKYTEVDQFMYTEAARGHNFRPVGWGYFYSPFIETSLSSIIRLYGMYMEDSLNFQLGDLFAKCTPGDIRIHYEIINPRSVGVIGQLGQNGMILPYTTHGGYKLGIVQPGSFSNDNEVIDKYLEENFWLLILCRLIGGIFFGVLTSITLGIDASRDGKKFFANIGMWGGSSLLVAIVLMHGFPRFGISSADLATWVIIGITLFCYLTLPSVRND